MKEKPIVDLKDAAQKALDHFYHVCKDAAYQNVAIEEIEKSENGEFWNVTIGYDAPTTDSVYSLSATARRFKILKVDILTEEVVSMKIRTFG